MASGRKRAPAEPCAVAPGPRSGSSVTAARTPKIRAGDTRLPPSIGLHLIVGHTPLRRSATYRGRRILPVNVPGSPSPRNLPEGGTRGGPSNPNLVEGRAEGLAPKAALRSTGR